jgi:hypothetical protein
VSAPEAFLWGNGIVRFPSILRPVGMHHSGLIENYKERLVDDEALWKKKQTDV